MATKKAKPQRIMQRKAASNGTETSSRDVLKSEVRRTIVIKKKTDIALDDGSVAIVHHAPLTSRQMIAALRAEQGGGLTADSVEETCNIVSSLWLDPSTGSAMWSKEEMLDMPFMEITMPVLRAILRQPDADVPLGSTSATT